MSKQRKKKYMLFLMGNFNDIEEILEEITNVIAIVMDSQHLRYIHHDNLIICNFESTAPLEEIDGFFDDTLTEVFESYFLILRPRRMGLRLDEEIEKHLFFNPKNTPPDKKQSKEIPRIKELMEGFVDHFQQAIRKKNRRTNFDLDEVLDKISAKGLESLTPDEKHFLKNIPK